MTWVNTIKDIKPAESGHRFSLSWLTLLASLLLLLALVIPESAHAQAIVVRSSGPSAAQYPKGKKLPADARITLKEQDRITLLDKNGTRELRGPGIYSLAATLRNQPRDSRIGGLISTSARNRRARTGAVRGENGEQTGEKHSPNLWYIDVRQSGNVCVADSSSLVFWRDSYETDASLTITNGDNLTVALPFLRGNVLKSWPREDMALVDGANYTLRDETGAESLITIRLLQNVPEDIEGIAVMLAENGCDNQLNLIVDTLEK